MAQHLGKAISLLLEYEVKLDVAAADIAAFGAPGECMALVRRGHERRRAAILKRALRLAGVKTERSLWELASRRGLTRRHREDLHGRLYDRLMPPYPYR